MDVPETQDSRDARIEELWRKIAKGKGEVSLKAFSVGLRKMDHPLKNANDMLREIFRAMDKNGDNVIEYEGRLAVFIA